jgi:hypothetical protein
MKTDFSKVIFTDECRVTGDGLDSRPSGGVFMSKDLIVESVDSKEEEK